MILLKQKIVILAVFCVLALWAGAQSTPTYPYEGATHTYVLNGLKPGTGYVFYMSANYDGSSVIDDESCYEFDFLTATYGNVKEGQNTASLPIVWNNRASEHVYYLWVELTGSSGCTSKRGLKIVPQQNMFDLLSENIPVDNTMSCPSIDDNSGFNPMFSEFNAGTTTIKFKVRREGGARGWMFEPHVSMNPSWNVDTEIVSVKAVNAGVLTANEANIYTVPASDSEVVVTVAVRNYEGTEQLVSLEIRNQKEEQTLLFDTNPDNDKVEHRISVMPVISELEEI